MNRFIMIALCLLSYGGAQASGFEKVTIWGAKSASLSNADGANVGGADALLFNPAGLVKGPDKEMSFNFSPTVSRFSGLSVPGSSETYEGEYLASPIFGFLAKHKRDDKWSWGYGLYALGGTRVDYGKQNLAAENPGTFAAVTLQPEVSSALSVLEASLAAAYKINEKWNVGIGWRATYVEAEYSAINLLTTPFPIVSAIKFENLKGHDLTGFRLGTQYNEDKWGVGFVFRSKIEFSAEGEATTTSQRISNGLDLGTTTEDVEIKNAFPANYDLDGYYRLNDLWTLYAGFTYMDYSVNEEFIIKSDGALDGATIPQDWKDSQSFSFGAEYCGFAMPVRGSFQIVTPSTNEDKASAGYTPPGNGYAIAGGTSFPFANGTFDFALEIGGANGRGTPYYALAGESGDFKSEYLSTHLSYKKSF